MSRDDDYDDEDFDDDDYDDCDYDSDGKDEEAAPSYYYNDKKFDEMLEILNALTLKTESWHTTRARKEHIDLWGEVIHPGDTYYRHQWDFSWHESLELSRLSMDRFLFVLFAGNPDLKELATLLHKKREERRAGVLSGLGQRDILRETAEPDSGS